MEEKLPQITEKEIRVRCNPPVNQGTGNYIYNLVALGGKSVTHAFLSFGRKVYFTHRFIIHERKGGGKFSFRFCEKDGEDFVKIYCAPAGQQVE